MVEGGGGLMVGWQGAGGTAVRQPESTLDFNLCKAKYFS